MVPCVTESNRVTLRVSLVNLEVITREKIDEAAELPELNDWVFWRFQTLKFVEVLVVFSGLVSDFWTVVYHPNSPPKFFPIFTVDIVLLLMLQPKAPPEALR